MFQAKIIVHYAYLITKLNVEGKVTPDPSKNCKRLEKFNIKQKDYLQILLIVTFNIPEEATILEV